MKILLFNPPLFDPGKYGKELLLGDAPAVGLGYIGAVLKKEGYDASVHDMYFQSWQEVEATIKKGEPQIVGITCLTEGRQNAFKLARLIKSINSQIKVVLGGHHATYMWEQVLKNYQVDVIVIGEGEITFLELVKALEKGSDLNGVKGIAFRENGRLIKTPRRPEISDLDQVPYPLYRHFDFESYPNYRLKMAFEKRAADDMGRYISIVTSRGCPANCLFCSTSNFWGRKWRPRSAENVLDEIEMLYKDYNARYINFADDAFTVDPERVIAICKGIVKRKLNIVWDCTTRVNFVSGEMLEWMKRSGCFFLSFGIESGCTSILKNINKRITIPQIETAFKLAKKAGLRTVAFIMVGNPGENEASIKETAALLDVIKPWQTGVVVTMVFPGTALYDLAKQRGFIDDDYWLAERPPPYYTADHPIEQLQAWKTRLNFASLQWYKKPKFFYMYSVRGPLFNLALHSRNFLAQKTGVKITRRGAVFIDRG